jgi:hypothetical protein
MSKKAIEMGNDAIKITWENLNYHVSVKTTKLE